MAHWLKALVDFVKNLGFVPSSHFRQLTTSIPQVLGNQMPSSDLTGHPHVCAQTHTYIHIN